MGIRAENLTGIKTLESLKKRSNELIGSFYEVGLTSDTAKLAIEISGEIVDLVPREDYLDAIKIFKDYKPYVLSHPFMVSLISVMMCRRLEWNSYRTLKIVALGGLLHNIGMTKMPENVKFNHPEDLSKEDFAIYMTHPEEGMKMASEFPDIPAAALQIIFQHHEGGGRGFPNGLADVKIFPLAKIVGLADRFTRFNFENDTILVDGLRMFLADKVQLSKCEPENIKALVKSFIRDDKLIR